MIFWKRNVSSILCTWLTLQSMVLGQKAQDYKVTSLPGIDIDQIPFDQYAGHIEVAKETNGNLFFWMLNQVQPTKPKKLIIWLNGGPGCSSMDGLFLENGPYRVNPDLTLSINPNGWQDHATIVFLDQPVGTGFSFTNSAGLVHNMSMVAQEFTTFLDKFMVIFPNLKDQDLYLAGESFAGTYIPYLANRILELNQKEKKKYNLKGIAIGNGWISPRHQYEAYYDYSVAHDLLEGQYLEKATENLNKCRIELSLETRINNIVCEDILQDVIKSSTHKTKSGEEVCINTYDIRLKNETSPECGLTWPHELTDVNKYLRTDELKKAIHSEKQVLLWQECTNSVHTALRHDPSLPADLLLPGILEEIKVLLFSGEYDLICNHIGTEYMISNMTWNGARGFKDAEQQDWFIGDKQAGYYTEERNLSYVLIKDGSHMVPYDKPMETLDMINRFMGVGDTLVDGTKIPSEKPPVHENEDLGNNDNDDGDATSTKDDDTTTSTKDDDATTTTTSTEEEEQEQEGIIGGYGKSVGNYSALIVFGIVLAIGVGCYWKRIKSFFAHSNNPTKFRLNDQDETNELDELVVGDTHTLFAAEQEEEEEHVAPPVTRSASRFAIADSDDGFDDFADWDEEETVALTKPKKDGKDH